MSVRPFVVTLSARATMCVWVEAESADAARRAALAGDYSTMTDWEPDATPTVRKVARTDSIPREDSHYAA